MWPRGVGDGDEEVEAEAAAAAAATGGSSAAAGRARRAPRGGGRQASRAGAGTGKGGEDERVYRPLLFQSKGYASSELFRDAYEMRVRMQAGDAGADSDGSVETGDWQLQKTGRHGAGVGVGRPRIRLETLSSRAATTVLSITYLSFLVALVLPYLQSQGYLETDITLPGGYCSDRVRPHDPCILVDKLRDTARWSAYVGNVSWYAGAMEVKLRVDELVNQSAPLLESDEFEFQQLEHIGEAWRLARATHRGENRAANGLAAADGSSTLDADELGDEGYVLHYGYELYGIDTSTMPYAKIRIAAESNQSVWVNCHQHRACDVAKLFEISQDFEDLRGNGYGSYLVVITYDGLYPNVFGKKVLYDFAYTKPSVHVSEVVVRGIFLLSSILALPCWLIAVLNFHDGSWSDVLTVQKWVLGLGVVLVLWQNPVYAATEMARAVSLRTRFVSISCESFAEAFFYVFWLNLLDQHAGDSALVRRSAFVLKALLGLSMFAVDTVMTVLRMPSLFMADDSYMRAFLPFGTRDELYALLGFARIALLLVWLTWIAVIGVRTGAYLRALPYMATRFKQLSFRFLFLETLLILVYVMALSALQVFYLFQTWYLMGYGAFIQDSVHTFAKLHTGWPSLGKFVFLSVYVYLVMFVHLPPRSGDGTGLFASTAFHVEEKPRLDSYGFLTPDSNLFCVETAKWLLELAWQAYFDPPGKPTPSGYGEINLERFGFELITHLRSSLTDTHVIVALSQGDRSRLVISFRGTTSKQNWKSNLRADQRVLWIKSRGLRRRRRTCTEVAEDVAARIPVLNMTLPRVHRGFWIAYESVRSELREVVRLILDENPGVSVYMTGHSMGGALAVLGAYDLAVNFNMKVNMYSFGGPRVGNPSFRHLYDKSVPTSYRVVMDGDIVPGVPKFWGLYQHVGTEVALDVEGNLIVDPSFVERHLHASSKRKLTMHGTNVYRVSLAKCVENLS